MRRRLLVSLTVLSAALAVAMVQAQPPAPVLHAPSVTASFYAIGDLPGGGHYSVVRDATRVGGTLMAVGNSSALNLASPVPDTPILWTRSGGTSTLTALPALSTGSATASAGAITRSGAYIAGQSRSNGPAATRIFTSAVTIGNTNNQLTLTPSSLAGVFRLFDDLTTAPLNTRPQQAVSITEDGNILYGAVSSFRRAARFDIPTGVTTMIPLVAPWLGNLPAPRGMSSNGSVMVGTGFDSLGPTFTGQNYYDAYGGQAGRHAFRYEHGTPGTATAIPKIAGGTWSKALAVTPDGNLTVVAGDSQFTSKGEIYIHNASTGTLTSLGSPNSGFIPASWGGVTSDGAVVAVSFSQSGGFVGADRYPYIHNAQGWFHLMTVLAKGGVDLDGWDDMQITGMSSDGTLVFGYGEYNGGVEGWVAEFAAGDLAAFNIQATAPSNTAIVGVWALGPVSEPFGVVAFMKDGTYVIAEEEGMERGFYTWDGHNLTIQTKMDSSGASGLSDSNGFFPSLSVSGDELRFPAGCVPTGPDDDDCAILGRINGATGTIVGGWIMGDPTADDSSTLLVFTSSGKYFHAEDGPVELSGRDGVEIGIMNWNPSTHVFAPQLPLLVDTNGEWGASNLSGPATAVLNADELQLALTDEEGTYPATRIVDPQTVVPQITSASSATGVVSTSFSYTATATRTLTFAATSLPDGLSIDSVSGVISGTPTTPGSYDAQLSATNTLATGTITLHIEIENTVTGTNVVVIPEVPAGSGGITLQFSTVTEAGDTTVTPIPAGTGEGGTPPSGFSFGNPAIYYDVETTAEFTGPVTLCFSYAGVNLGGGEPRLFHFEGGTWVDITTSVDTGAMIICGSATSFSPFAVFVTPYVRSGFYAPVTAPAGTFNTVKAGSTVPLMFNVHVNGVEKKDTSDLTFSVFQIGCLHEAGEDPVEFTSTGNTSLRYSDGVFIQNWKTPRTPGACYLVKMTTLDGLSLTAMFKLK